MSCLVGQAGGGPAEECTKLLAGRSGLQCMGRHVATATAVDKVNSYSHQSLGILTCNDANMDSKSSCACAAS
eukprot:1965427-Amphidinium_carterae.1